MKTQTEMMNLVDDLQSIASKLLSQHQPEDANKLKEIAEYLESLDSWIIEGGGIVDSSRLGAIFRLGVWWGERPWRGL